MKNKKESTLYAAFYICNIILHEIIFNAFNGLRNNANYCLIQIAG